MRNPLSRPPVDKNSGACRGQKDGDPVRPTPREADVLKDLYQEWPGNRIKCLGDVHFEEHRGEVL
jgi:hypothetical protein